MIKIVVDSGCDLPEEYLKNKFLKDGVDIKGKEFFNLKKERKDLNTSQPPLEDFINIYKKIIENGNEILSIHITGKGLGRVKIAKIARDEVSKEKIDVFDSNQISALYGFIVKRIQESIERGLTRSEIIKKIQ